MISSVCNLLPSHNNHQPLYLMVCLFLQSLSNSLPSQSLKLNQRPRNQSLSLISTAFTLSRTPQTRCRVSKPRCNRWWCNRWWCSNSSSTKHPWWAWTILICTNSNRTLAVPAWVEDMEARTPTTPMGHRWVATSNSNNNHIISSTITIALLPKCLSKWTVLLQGSQPLIQPLWEPVQEALPSICLIECMSLSLDYTN